jgi:hypothetical protein
MEICEFYPPPEREEPICDCGAEISEDYKCNKEQSLECPWAIKMREENS